MKNLHSFWLLFLLGFSGFSLITCCNHNVPTGDAVLYVGLMIHLEGHKTDTREAHDIYADGIKSYTDIFDEYGARVTWEVKEPIESCDKFNDYYFKDIENRGHGIGVHADIGGNRDDTAYTYTHFVNDLKFMKKQLEKQDVTVRHASGICSHLDWVSGVIEAGYSFVTGIVGYCTVSLPEELIPEEYKDCLGPGDCHDLYPDELQERMHPWRANTKNWTEYDPNGELVILPAAINGLLYLAELQDNPDYNGDFQFTLEDIDAYIDLLEEAITYVDPDKVNTFYLSWSYGKALDEALIHEWLLRIESYIEEGKVEWKTLPEMYDIYVEWEKNQCSP